MSKHADVAHTPAIAVATAVLAVLAAIGTMVSNKTSSEALAVQNRAILVRTDASDAYNSYESHEIRAHIYEAAELGSSATGAAARKRVAATAVSEQRAAGPFLNLAREKEREAAEDSERSERLAHAHELYDVAIALVEISVALISVSTLAASWYLVGFAGLCAAAGIGTFIFGAIASP